MKRDAVAYDRDLLKLRGLEINRLLSGYYFFHCESCDFWKVAAEEQDAQNAAKAHARKHGGESMSEYERGRAEAFREAKEDCRASHSVEVQRVNALVAQINELKAGMDRDGAVVTLEAHSELLDQVAKLRADAATNNKHEAEAWKQVEAATRALSRTEARLERLIHAARSIQCSCSIPERAGHLLDCWKPELDEAIGNAEGGGNQ